MMLVGLLKTIGPVVFVGCDLTKSCPNINMLGQVSLPFAVGRFFLDFVEIGKLFGSKYVGILRFHYFPNIFLGMFKFGQNMFGGF